MRKVKIDKKLKGLIEKTPMALATAMPDGKPNVIGVACVKVVGEDKLLVTDNFMNQTIKDIKNNPSVAMVVWDKDMNGFKLVGKAKYFDKGEWLNKVKVMPENKGLPAKGAILVKVELIIKSA
jgi:predicted pyridoxine 5'-phosphate oxidase superfamily flavin-nucleotide-binding protein